MDTRGAGYLRTGKEGREYWMYYPVGTGWLAAYCVTYHGEGAQRRARIGELRIVPRMPVREHNGFHPSRRAASYEAQAAAAGRTIPPFPFEDIRRSITPRFFTDALASINALRLEIGEEPEAWGTPAPQLDTESPLKRVGRPATYDRAFYAKIAVQYHAIEHGTRKEPGASTRAILARKHKVPVTTIGKWIRIARQHKLLTPVRSGQRGGMATAAAFALARGDK